MKEILTIHVEGEPLPKQSFRALKRGGGYTDGRVAKWQRTITSQARLAMAGRQVIAGPVEVSIAFWRKDNTRVDVDNLSKAVLDSLNKTVWLDDQQVHVLHLAKFVDPLRPGVVIEVSKLEG